MAHGADISVVAQNTGLSDTVAAAKMSAINITQITQTGDLSIITDTTTMGAGQIERLVHVHFLAPFLSKFPTDAMQANALIGILKSIIEKGLPHPHVAHTVTLVP